MPDYQLKIKVFFRFAAQNREIFETTLRRIPQPVPYVTFL